MSSALAVDEASRLQDVQRLVDWRWSPRMSPVISAPAPLPWPSSGGPRQRDWRPQTSWARLDAHSHVLDRVEEDTILARIIDLTTLSAAEGFIIQGDAAGDHAA